MLGRELSLTCDLPAKVGLNLGPQARPADYFVLENQNVELLRLDPEWRPYIFYKCCGLRPGEGGCAIGAHVVEGELWSDTAATQGDISGAGFPLPDH